jgi:hypothetical protein
MLAAAAIVALVALAGDADRLMHHHTTASLGPPPPSPARAHDVHRLPMLPTYPFRPSVHDRRPTKADALPALWADGIACSVGCRPLGAIDGWPLKPFHRQHALRAGLNERRDGSLHEGLDIQAYDGQRVYAIQPGYAHILVPSGPEARVRIGNFIYWHVAIAVKEGQYVKPYSTLVGRVNRHRFGHLHLSEVTALGSWLNPLRPGGRVLSPWKDTDPPVIATPRIQPDGHVLVRAFDPQSFTTKTTYDTPVLAPAGLGYQLFNSAGTRLGPVHWAVRSNRVLPGNDAPLLFAPDAKQPGFSCFATKVVCKPDWDYVLAGGNAPGLGAYLLPPGRYRLVVYAWDYAGNATARDQWYTVGPAHLFARARAPH